MITTLQQVLPTFYKQLIQQNVPFAISTSTQQILTNFEDKINNLLVEDDDKQHVLRTIDAALTADTSQFILTEINKFMPIPGGVDSDQFITLNNLLYRSLNLLITAITLVDNTDNKNFVYDTTQKYHFIKSHLFPPRLKDSTNASKCVVGCVLTPAASLAMAPSTLTLDNINDPASWFKLTESKTNAGYIVRLPNITIEEQTLDIAAKINDANINKNQQDTYKMFIALDNENFNGVGGAMSAYNNFFNSLPIVSNLPVSKSRHTLNDPNTGNDSIVMELDTLFSTTFGVHICGPNDALIQAGKLSTFMSWLTKQYILGLLPAFEVMRNDTRLNLPHRMIDIYELPISMGIFGAHLAGSNDVRALITLAALYNAWDYVCNLYNNPAMLQNIPFEQVFDRFNIHLISNEHKFVEQLKKYKHEIDSAEGKIDLTYQNLKNNIFNAASGGIKFDCLTPVTNLPKQTTPPLPPTTSKTTTPPTTNAQPPIGSTNPPVTQAPNTAKSSYTAVIITICIIGGIVFIAAIVAAFVGLVVIPKSKHKNTSTLSHRKALKT